MEVVGIYLFACFYFYLPAAMANIGANIAKFIPLFKSIKKPIDFGLKINGNRIIGDHKNLGGFLFGTLFGFGFGIFKTIYLDKLISDQYLLVQIDEKTSILLYLIMSFFALFGDVFKSILKRTLNRDPHSPWIPFDEMDHSVFAMLAASSIVSISLKDVLTVVMMFIVLHLASNVIGYLLKIKNVPY